MTNVLNDLFYKFSCKEKHENCSLKIVQTPDYFSSPQGGKKMILVVKFFICLTKEDLLFDFEKNFFHKSTLSRNQSKKRKPVQETEKMEGVNYWACRQKI